MLLKDLDYIFILLKEIECSGNKKTQNFHINHLIIDILCSEKTIISLPSSFSLASLRTSNLRQFIIVFGVLCLHEMSFGKLVD